MKRAYVALFAIALASALALSAFGHHRRLAPHTAPVPAEAPPIDLALELRDGEVRPAGASVPKDHRVRLAVVNRGSVAASLQLAGYQDRVSIDHLEPGAARAIVFLADRPGDDFTWLVNGHPSGRFTVSGSHLMAGHR